MDTQIKSKERVLAYGEVFTNPREVNAMLDLVKPETDRIDSRFLEPACGDGNFLIEILRRKLAICETRVTAKRYTQLQYEHDAVWAVSSIYGIEIQEDNASACRERLLNYFMERYNQLFKSKCKAACIESVRYILSKTSSTAMPLPTSERTNLMNGYTSPNGVLSVATKSTDATTSSPIWSVNMKAMVSSRTSLSKPTLLFIS